MRSTLFILATLSLASCGQKGDDAQNNGSVTLELPPATPLNVAAVEINVGAANVDEEAALLNAGEAEATASNENQAAPKGSAPEEGDESAATAEPPATEKEGSAAAKQENSAPSRPGAADEVKLLPTGIPLEGAEVARVIERIGFACGQVVSSNRVDNPGGDFTYKVNCSSGKSYQGTMRDGRLRFREWTGRIVRD